MNAIADSCVYLDIFTGDAAWSAWSARALADALNKGTVVLNPVIYAEISIRFERIEDIEDFLTAAAFDYQPITHEASFLAGKCFLKYRQRGGVRTTPLPDFYIGAHAAVSGLPLITRDPRRFRTYFPSVRLITP